MIVDVRQWSMFDRLDCDVCVIGAGPAGIVLALELGKFGMRVLVLESGALLPSARSQQLNRADNTGQKYWALDSTRHRVLGGSGNRWGGVCRPLDASDYGPRSWVDGDGWPISSEEVDPYIPAAAAALALTSDRFDVAAFADVVPPAYPLDGSDFESVMFQSSPLTTFGHDHHRRLSDADNVTVMLGATVVDLRLSPGTSRVDRVVIALPDGSRRTAAVPVVVLATGAVENARTLLAARRDRPSGLGNEHEVVGRYFMEHPHVPMGHLVPTGAAVDRRVYEKTNYGGAELRAALAPTAAAQRSHELLNCTISVESPLYTYGSPFIDWPSAVTAPAQRLFLQVQHRRAVAESVVDEAAGSARAAAKRAWYASRSISARRAVGFSRRVAEGMGLDASTLYSLYVRAEQVPDPSSRVSLTDATDRFGTPRAALHWKIGDQDVASMLAWVDRLSATVAERGLGHVIAPAEGWQEHFIGGPHHIGTTRMSASPRSGVVDGNCKVHTVDNVYVAGSSVFTTGGHANPTFTLVALALRLAGHLHRTYGESPAAVGEQSQNVAIRNE